MTAIMPRWEWRVFGVGLRAAEVAAVRGLGLDGRVNTSYPRGLAALVDAAPARYGVIDVGTNSVRFHIGERGPDGGWRVVVDRAELTRLGEGLESQGVIAAEPLERTVAAIAAMVEEARRHRVRATGAVRTVMDKLGQPTLTVSDRGLRHGLLLDRFDG
jgi:exopolyphosphatase/guanosine-5'-triphosphate,3'-diphosphate pyrophosphatase